MDHRKLTTRGAVLGLCATLVIGGLVIAAQADNALGRALRERKATVEKLGVIHELRRVARLNLHRQIRDIQARIVRANAKGPSLASDRQRWTRNQARLTGLRHDLRLRLHRLERFVRRRTEVLRTQRSGLSTWIHTYGIFRTCPVRGPLEYVDDFGYVVARRPGTPQHIHQGVDIVAPSGTPIVAPFDGVAEASSNALGGQAVKVYGAAGFVYNAHLSAFGSLGKVKAGDVIGYVGSTGNAGGPHDHFEWHPGNGAAIDPYPYLNAVC